MDWILSLHSIRANQVMAYVFRRLVIGHVRGRGGTMSFMRGSFLNMALGSTCTWRPFSA
jgi:hypothetical protein